MVKGRPISVRLNKSLMEEIEDMERKLREQDEKLRDINRTAIIEDLLWLGIEKRKKRM